jgi:hypothetical protein
VIVVDVRFIERFSFVVLLEIAWEDSGLHAPAVQIIGSASLHVNEVVPIAGISRDLLST